MVFTGVSVPVVEVKVIKHGVEVRRTPQYKFSGEYFKFHGPLVVSVQFVSSSSPTGPGRPREQRPTSQTGSLYLFRLVGVGSSTG